jgi:flagellar hook-length control protein FliK
MSQPVAAGKQATAAAGAANADSASGSPAIPAATVPTHDHPATTTEHPVTAPADGNVPVPGGFSPQLPTTTTNLVTAGPLTATAATGAAVPLSGLAVEIAASAKNGKSNFEIRLDPADLGRIDVRISVDSSGQMTSHLMVEKAETLSMLQQDAPQLQQALNDAGFKTGDSGLQFSLRDQSSSGQNSGNDTNRNAQRLIVSPEDTAAAAPAGRTYGRMPGSSSGVDISV